MRKVGIMSMQRIANYGSFLQAYALKQLIEEVGCNVEFVDYHVGAPVITENADSKNKVVRKIEKGLETFRYRAPLAHKLSFIRYKQSFAQKYMPLLGITDEMNYNPTVDCLVIGSDEVFNCIQKNSNVGYSPELFGKNNHAKKLIGNVLHTFFIAVLNILFLLVFKEGVDGYLKAYIIANTLTAIYAIIVGKGYKSFSFSRIDRDLLIKMARYSVVLIPNSFMWWIMNSSDRIMVSSMISVAANGIYAVSYKFPTLVSTLTTIFNQAWSYSAIREEGTDDESEYNNKIFRVLIGIVMLIGIGLLTFMKPFLSVYVGKEYYSAWKYTPFLTVGCVYLTMASFMATSYTVHKDSFGYLFSGTFGAIFNIAMNFILIPQVGVYGAAIATCISYILVFVFRLFHTRKYIQYNINNKEFIVGSTALVLSAGLMFIDNRFGFLLQCVILAVTIYLFSDIWLPIVRKILKLKGR